MLSEYLVPLCICIDNLRWLSCNRIHLLMQKMLVRFLDQEDPLENEMATTPVFLPGKSHGWRSVVGYSPWGRKESDMTERPHFHFHTYISSLLSRPPTPLFPPLLGVTEHTVGKMLFFLLQLLQPAWPFPLSYSICRPPAPPLRPSCLPILHVSV